MQIMEIELYAQSESQSVDLNEIKNINVRTLLDVLSAGINPVTKEELFEKVFKIPYDPIIHDAKLYKLIMNTRKEVATDIIINHHGTYSYNSKKINITS